MKIALFAFNGDPMCFVHVLLNALDLQARGNEVELVIEGSATKLAKDLHEDAGQPFAPLYKKVKEAGLIGAVCKACAGKTGALESVMEQGLPLGEDMSGHPSMGKYLDHGYQVITF